jgi:hypothetical protein
MTLNIVLKARGGDMIEARARNYLCRDRPALARCGELTLTGADLAARLLARNGPLDLVRPENIDRIETNLQIAHAPKSALREFRTDYLLKVFRFDPVARAFEKRRWKTRSIASGCWLTQPSARLQGVAARSQASQ